MPQACGDWSENLAFTADNQHAAEFRLRGAAQYRRHGRRSARSAGPRRAWARRTPTRRATVMDHYEKGEVTQADKHTADKPTEQSGAVSDVGQ